MASPDESSDARLMRLPVDKLSVAASSALAFSFKALEATSDAVLVLMLIMMAQTAEPHGLSRLYFAPGPRLCFGTRMIFLIQKDKGLPMAAPAPSHNND